MPFFPSVCMMEGSSSDDCSNVELGYASELGDPPFPRFPLEDADPRKWDGGKTGGRPVRCLLSPSHTPHRVACQ